MTFCYCFELRVLGQIVEVIQQLVARQSVSKNHIMKIGIIHIFLRGFLSHFSSHLPHFYDVKSLIFETLCPATTVLSCRLPLLNQYDSHLNDSIHKAVRLNLATYHTSIICWRTNRILRYQITILEKYINTRLGQSICNTKQNDVCPPLCPSVCPSVCLSFCLSVSTLMDYA